MMLNGLASLLHSAILLETNTDLIIICRSSAKREKLIKLLTNYDIQIAVNITEFMQKAKQLLKEYMQG